MQLTSWWRRAGRWCRYCGISDVHFKGKRLRVRYVETGLGTLLDGGARDWGGSVKLVDICSLRRATASGFARILVHFFLSDRV